MKDIIDINAGVDPETPLANGCGELTGEVKGLYCKVFREVEYLADLKELIESKREWMERFPGNDDAYLTELITTIGALKNTHNIPADKRKTFPETKRVIQNIREHNGVLELGTNTYLVPGSLASMHRLLENTVVMPENISIVTGEWVNIQEGIRFVKVEQNGHGPAQKHFVPERETLERLCLDIGHHTSLAHESTFLAKTLSDDTYEVCVDIAEDSFIGINAKIASGSRIGARTTIWWNSKIGFDTVIGDDTVVGMASEVQDGIVLPPNCLVPNHALITPEFSIIPFDLYKQNEIKYDTMVQSAPGRRNFVIELGDRTDGEVGKNSYDTELQWINPDYFVMSQFNKEVTRENKEFAVIDSFLSLVHERYPSLGILREQVVNPVHSREEIYERCNGKIPYELIDLTFKRGSLVTFKAYPKDKASFILEGMPAIIECMQKNGDIDAAMQWLLAFPQVSGDINTVFFGRNIIIGNCHVDDASLIYNSHIRLDEMGEDACRIKNSVLIKNTIHGWYNKHITDAHITHSVIHGKQDITSIEIGEMGYPSTYNNTVLSDSTALGGVTANNVSVEHSNLGFATTISATSGSPTVLKAVSTGEWAFIGRGNRLTNVDVSDAMVIANGITLSNTVMTKHGLYDKKH